LATLADHIDGCAACQAALDGLEDAAELSELRPRGPTRNDTPHASAAGLMRVLADIRAGSTPHVAAIETTDERAVGLPVSLGPPRREGDIGSLDSYFVRREIGRGGMGIVFEAFDPDLDRPVAIKMLRMERIDAASRARFVREAQAAARLKHEHVVTVYSVVSPPAAPPYFVMEFIAGLTLRERIDREQRLAPREAAELCVQIADGLAAAHATGLVHRDVKPSNVLMSDEWQVTSDEQKRRGCAAGASLVTCHSSLSAKLTDFGLARLTALPPGSTLTHEGMVAGTPAYMSPEQVREPGRADPRSDVYSLGVTLYEMITGDVPFHGEPHMVLRQVEFDEPPAPRRLNDAVPVELETICLKTMAKEPDRRFQSARELADDLRRWLGGEPIRARPAGSVARLRLWARRSPRVAALTAAVFGLLMMLAIGSSISAAWISREQARTEQKRIDAVRAGVEAKQSAEAARQAERNEAEQARLARESAESARVAEEKAKSLAKSASDGRSVAMDSLNTLIVKVMDRLGDTAGTIKLREELIQTAIDGLNRVSENAEKDASLDRNVMLTHQRLGLIYIDSGRTADARAQFERSRELVERLLASDPGNALLERDLARAFGKLGDIAYHNLDDAAAEESYSQAQAIYEAHLASDPESVPARDGLSITHNNFTRLFERQGKLATAREHAEKSLAIAEELAASQSDTRFQRGLVVTLGRLGLVCERQYDFDGAGRHYRRQVELAEQLVAREPANATWLSDLSVTLQNLSKLHERQWQFGDAATLSRRSLALAESRAKQDPENAVAQRNLAIGFNALGDVQVHLDADAARASFRRAFEIATEQARRDAASVQKAADLIDNCSKLAALEAHAGHYAAAATWIKYGHGQLDRLVAATGELQVPALIAWKTSSREELAAYEVASRSIESSDAWRELPAAVQSRLARLRAVELARTGRVAEAASAAKTLVMEDAATPDDLFAAATAYAACVAAVHRSAAGADRESTTLTAEQSASRDRYAQSAIDTARRFFESNPSAVQVEHKIFQLDPIRTVPEYGLMITDFRQASHANSK
jgi:tetratricopeptide (TPR) repeat protein